MLKLLQNVWQLLKSADNWAWAFACCFIVFAAFQGRPTFLPAFIITAGYFTIKYLDVHVFNDYIKKQVQ